MSLITKRKDIFKKFERYVQRKDGRSMDQICMSSEGTFKLQVQQEFLREFIKASPNWRHLLLYHNIGAGKTCTSITMAEEYLRMFPANKVKVILPARLRTNFFDELISPCGMEKYISREDFERYYNPSTKQGVRKNIKTSFMKKIEEHYEIMSFEKLKTISYKHKDNLEEWVQEFTNDCMLIVDEVHNLLSDKYDNKKYKSMYDGKVLVPSKGMNTIVFKLINDFASPSCKMIYMTATPIFDNIAQMKELVTVMAPGVKISAKPKLGDVIDHLRGKVSYFPGTSVNAYPKVAYDVHEVPLSATMDAKTQAVLETDEYDEDKEAFMSKQREISIAYLPGSHEKDSKAFYDKLMKKPKEYCPKVLEIYNNIRDLDGKHLVFSNFIKHGLLVVETMLRKHGWVSLDEVKNNQNMWKNYRGKVYAKWDGSVKDADKTFIKGVVNSPMNLYGENVRVILGSPSIKEGVSFKHIQHMHLLDPVWNQSAKTQVEGRAIRFCSHVDIGEDEMNNGLRREVVVHIYKIVPRKGGLVVKTCDQIIYDEIIPKKMSHVESGERALKRVSIDYHLFKNLYSKNNLEMPIVDEENINSAKSDLDLEEDDKSLLLYKHSMQKKTNSCPKKRRPKDDKCPDKGYYMKKNKHGDLCCYKDKSTAQPKCPKGRTPVDGKCEEGFVVKKNKKGQDCCFKMRVTKTTKST